jgi:hypothetical protein
MKEEILAVFSSPLKIKRTTFLGLLVPISCFAVLVPVHKCLTFTTIFDKYHDKIWYKHPATQGICSFTSLVINNTNKTGM